VARQAALGDCLDGPSERMVELSERLVDIVAHADWAMFQKNGTTPRHCAARSHARRRASERSSWQRARITCRTVVHAVETGTTAEDRANLVHYTYNDLESVREAFSDDVAAVLVSPFRHDAASTKSWSIRRFARGLVNSATPRSGTDP